MSILDSFYEKFILRHDFEDSDIELFLHRWKNKCIIKNIPLAWVIPLDTMMFELNKKGYIVSSISQDYGQLIVSVPANEYAPSAFKIIEVAKRKIESIDKDLYSLFDIDIIRKEYFNQKYKFSEKAGEQKYESNMEN